MKFLFEKFIIFKSLLHKIYSMKIEARNYIFFFFYPLWWNIKINSLIHIYIYIYIIYIPIQKFKNLWREIIMTHSFCPCRPSPIVLASSSWPRHPGLVVLVASTTSFVPFYTETIAQIFITEMWRTNSVIRLIQL